MDSVSLVTVSYGSSGVLAEAIASFRREASRLGLGSQVVVVDHRGDRPENEHLAQLGPEVLLCRENLGYAAGLNAGAEAATGVALLLANPDLVFRPGSLEALLSALADGWDLVGPQFELGGALFPEAEEQTPRAELRRLSARHSEDRRLRYLRWHARSSWRLWQGTTPQRAGTISGALIAMRRETLAAVGPWDEGYFLYFEEADWLRRASSLGCRLGVVPGSRVRHAWGHAAKPEAQAETFERSRRRYYQRHFPHWRPPDLELPGPPEWPGLSTEAGPRRTKQALWLVSPSPWGFPAAGLGLLDGSELGQALSRFAAARSHGGPLFVSAYDPEDDAVLGTWKAGDPPTSTPSA